MTDTSYMFGVALQRKDGKFEKMIDELRETSRKLSNVTLVENIGSVPTSITLEPGANITFYLHKCVQEVLAELERASAKFGPFASAMEGQAIIAEEFDEFTQAVRHEGVQRAREEAVQLAAMAIRFLIDTENKVQKNDR